MIDPETPKRKQMPRRVRRGWMVLVGVVIVFAAVGIYGFWSLIANNTDLYCFGTLFPSEADMESRAFFELPPSAQNFEYAVERSERTTCTTWASFEIDPEDFQRLQESSRNTPLIPDIMIHPLFYSLMEQQGWQIPEHFVARYGVHSTEDHYVVMQLVLVDMTNLARLKVYIITSIPCAKSEPDCSIPL